MIMASMLTEKDCSICFKIFVNPKILPCHHLFCDECIQNLIKGSNVQCPTCNSFCGVDRIAHDFRTESFVKALQKQEEDFNRRILAATAASYAEPSAPPEPVETADKKCELCHDNAISFWCVECEQWICMSCKKNHLNTRNSKDHRIEQLSVKNKEVELALQTEIHGIKVKIDEFHTCIKSLQTEKQNTRDMQQKHLKQSKELRSQCILELNLKFNRIDQDIRKDTDEYSSILEREIKRYQQMVREVESRYNGFSAIIKKKDPKLAIQGANVIGQAKDFLAKTRSPAICIESLTLQLQRLPEWSAKAALLVTTGGSITQKSQSSAISPPLEAMMNRQWKNHHSVAVSATPYCLRNIRNKLYQCKKDGITTHDANQVHDIPNVSNGKVYDVCDMTNEDLVVATSCGLFQIKPDGQKVKYVVDGWFTSIVRHQDLYYAANAATATIQVYEHTGEWKQYDSFPIKGYIGKKITMGIVKDMLYVCTKIKHTIDVFSLKGKYQFSTGSRGSEEAGLLELPRICSTDAAGAVLVADFGNNRLQLLNSNGQWSLVQLHTPIEKPYSACLLNDNLYINEYKKRLLHAFIIQ